MNAAEDREPQTTRLSRWQARTEWPHMVAALAFLAAYAWPILDQDLRPSVETTLHAVTWATWGLFALDFLVRVSLAANRSSRYRV